MRVVAVALLFMVAGAVPQLCAASTSHRLPLPDPRELGDGAALADPGAAPVLDGLPLGSFASWGGSYAAGDGSVHVLVSSSYAVDPARASQWATFLDSLEHGDEIDRATLALQTPAQITASCGPFALACYRPDNETMYVPAEDPSSTTSVEGLVAHEYAHHIARNRSDAPWAALDYGPKHWSTYMGICEGDVQGTFFPGAESPGRYARNPGEGWAEAYRIMNEHRLGLVPRPWVIVWPGFYPDEGALAAMHEDIAAPWPGNTVATTSGRFTWRSSGQTSWRPPAGLTWPSRTRTTTYSTPLDGEALVSLWTSETLRARLDVVGDSGTLATMTVTGSMRVVRVSTCGVRAISARLTRLGGAGSYTVTVSHP